MWSKTFVYLLVSFRTYSCSFIKFCTIIISTIIKRSVSFSYWSSTTLVHKMPVETSKRSVLCAFVLLKQWTLLNTKFLQIPGMRHKIFISILSRHLTIWFLSLELSNNKQYDLRIMIWLFSLSCQQTSRLRRHFVN